VILGKSFYSHLLFSIQKYKWIPVRAEIVVLKMAARARGYETEFGLFHEPSVQG
jgi:hypothetical protein